MSFESQGAVKEHEWIRGNIGKMKYSFSVEHAHKL